jgi:hypothetical protein
MAQGGRIRGRFGGLSGSVACRAVARVQPAFAQLGFGAAAFTRFASEGWWARQDSNLQPDRYERPALTIELQAPPEPALLATGNGADTPYNAAVDPAMPAFARDSRVKAAAPKPGWAKAGAAASYGSACQHPPN